MQKKFWQLSLIGCLIAHPLMAEEMPSSPNMMMGQMMQQMNRELTENDLLQQMDDKDKITYQKLDAEGKALVLKMANAAKMNNNLMMMQKCKMMMDKMISNMMDKMNMNKQKNSNP